MIELYTAYENKLVGIFPTKDKLNRWIGRRANDWNYGIYREWSMDGKHYFDVGPRVFYVMEN